MNHIAQNLIHHHSNELLAYVHGQESFSWYANTLFSVWAVLAKVQITRQVSASKNTIKPSGGVLKPQAEYGDTGQVQIFVLTISVHIVQYLSG